MSSYTQGILILVCINLIAVFGVSILTGFTRLFSFGNAGFMSIGAYTSAILTTRANLPFPLAVVGGALLAMIIAYLLGSLTLRLKGDYFLIATLGFGECVRILFDNIQITGGARGFSGIPQNTNLVNALVWTAICWIFAWNLIHSKFGRNLISVREQDVAAEAVGIDTLSAKKMAFSISAAFAGVAGALYAHHLTFIAPMIFNLGKSAELTITTVIGGLGSLTGSFFGTLLVTLLPELFKNLANYRMLLYGTAVVLIIVLNPNGLFGYREFSITKIYHWIKSKFQKKGDQYGNS